ncbi:E3 UBIQUITIN-PROTEIN LIGASE UBR7 [Salix purpurea]|uniref:E3 UBIQUITIN-PROTEIN LIGASE UBR7 n=1 Tax=Salix purpurea TaxID=77065 RepID=A0A9Q0TJ79_SALPP|nr:E3 UBIQUITIN-PROTEIN LIGASE UBR7 [Salix purpurea]
MDDVFDDEVEQTVTIDEYLNNVEAEELNADLVLGEDEVTLTSTICSLLTSYPQKIWAAGGQKGDTTSSNAKSKGVLENVSSACGSGKLGIDICAHDSSEKDNTTANSNSQTVAARNASVAGESSGKSSGPNDSDQCTKDTNLHTTCALGIDVEVTSLVSGGKPSFLSKSWRDILCRCEKCLYMYNQKQTKSSP